MSPVRRRRLAAATLALTATVALSGCGTGFSAQTNQVYQAGVGANHRGEIDVLNTLLVANKDGSATLSASVLNTTENDESLSSVTATTLDDKPLDVRSTKVLLPLPAGVLTTLGGASDAGGHQVVSGVTTGAYVRITLNFTDAASVTIEAPVVARTKIYDSVVGNDGLSPSKVSGTEAPTG